MKKRILWMCALLALTSLAAFAADVTGKWTSEATGKGGPQTYTFKQDGAILTGSMQGGRGGPADISNGKVDGDNVSFELVRERGGCSKTMESSGTVSSAT